MDNYIDILMYSVTINSVDHNYQQSMKITNLLTKIGLTEKQAEVYSACLELGGARVSDIAKKAKVQRTTCYHLLSDLTQLGLVSKSKHKKAGFYVAEDPRNLEKMEKEKLQTIQILLPHLEAIHNVLPQKPKVVFYEGWEGAKNIYEDTLKLPEGEKILSFTGFKNFFEYMPKSWGEYYVKRRIAGKIRIKIIAPSSPFADELKESAAQELREIKIVPEKSWNFTTDTQIYGNKIAIISLKENFMSVLIESKEIADTLKMAFELMWKGAGA